MKHLTTTLLMLTTIMYVNAQYQTIPLWESTPPGNKNVQATEERMAPEGGFKILTKVTSPELWWFPSTTEGARPAVIICPGGGYGVEAYEHEGTQVAEWLTSLGYHAFVLKYRLPDETLFAKATYIPLADARKAILLVREKATEMKVNPDCVGIMGFSAGGHLAGSASTLFDVEIPYIESGSRVRPDFSILIYPVISMHDGLTHGGSKKALLGENPDPELVRVFSLEEQVTRETPPTFILHAADDKGVSVENTLQYAEALQNNKVPVKKIILPEGGHGFGYRKESPAFIWTEYLSTWLRELLDKN